MKSFTWIIIVLVFYVVLIVIPKCKSNDFSSFLSINASLAVVVDHEYMQQKGADILSSMQKILTDTIRENLKNGGVNLKFYTWNSVRLKKAAITIMDCKRTWNFYESTEANSILIFAITDSDCARLPATKALMIPVIEKGEELPQLLLDLKIQNTLNWKSCVMLLDESVINENSQIIETLVHDNSNSKLSPMSLYIYTINDSLRSHRKRDMIKEALVPFAKNSKKQFIVFSKSIEEIMEIAEELNMFHIYNQWLFFILEDNVNMNFESLTHHLNEGANIAFAYNETGSSCEESLTCMMTEVSLGFVSSLSQVIREEESIYGEISDEEWEAIRLTKIEKQTELLNYMTEYLKYNSKCSSCSKWTFKTAISWGKSQDIHKRAHWSSKNEIAVKGNYEFIGVGYWSPILGFVTNEAMFPHIEQGFRNITMHVVTYDNPPWQILHKNEKGDIVESSGIVIELLKELSRKLNFTYRLYDAKNIEDVIITDENDTPISDLKGSLTHTIPKSVVDLIRQNSYFIAAVACTIDDPGSKPFNYTRPFSVQKYTFMSRRPDEVSRIYLFTAPFTIETWASLVGVLLITAPLLYFINILVPTEELRTKGLCKINSCFWYVYGALLQQGGIYLPRADSGRLIIGVWWIAVIVLVTTYCGNLVSFLTFPKYQPGIDYLFQTFRHNDVEQFGLRNGTYFEKYTKISNRNDFKRYMDRAIIYNNLSTENIVAVERGERVNIDWRINLQLTIQSHFEKDKECKFILGKEDFVAEQIGMLMPPNSPYISLVNNEIKRLHQMGFIDRWHKINLPLMDKCNGKAVLRQITNHKVNLTDMQGCFLVLLIGFSIAMFCMFIEYWCRRLHICSRKNLGEYSI